MCSGPSAASDARDLGEGESAPRAAGDSVRSERAHDHAQRHALATQSVNASCDRSLVLVLLERSVCARPISPRNVPRSLPSCPLRTQSSSSALANERALELRDGVEDRALEALRGRVTGADTICAHHARAGALRSALDGGGDHDVARESIASGDDEHTRAVLADGIERGEEARAVVDLGSAAKSVFVDRGEGDGVPLRPASELRALGFGAELLAFGGRAHVPDGNGGGASLGPSHAPSGRS